jgi:DNA repair exonuclease SbcCD nuclease subunit
MFTFLHAADIHLDSPLHRLDAYEGVPVDLFRGAARRAFENLVRLALAEKAAFVVIAGDLFDGDWRDYNTGLHLVSQMNRLGAAGIRVFLLAGNHDATGRITRTLRLPDNVRLFPADRPATFRIEELGVSVHGQSFATPAVRRDLSRDYPEPVAGDFNLGVLHTGVTGREGHEPYAPCSPESLRNKGYDYWALGHVHRHEIVGEDPPVLFSGNIQGRHIRETGPKGCVRVRVDDAGRAAWSFVALDVVRWAAADVDAADAGSAYEVVDRTRARLEALTEENDGKPLAVRIRLSGTTTAHGDLSSDPDRWTSEIRAAANEAGGGRIWVEKIRIDTRAPAAGADLPATGAIAELTALFESLSADPDARRELFAELDDVKRKLPPELRDGDESDRFDDPDRSSDLLEKARQMLIRRLLRREEAP